MALNFITSNPTIDAYGKAEKDANEARLRDAESSLRENQLGELQQTRGSRFRKLEADAGLAESNADVGRQTVGSRVRGADATAAQHEIQNFGEVMKHLQAGNNEAADMTAARIGVKIPDSLKNDIGERNAVQAAFDYAQKAHPNSPELSRETFRANKDEMDSRIAAGEPPAKVYRDFYARLAGALQQPGAPAAQAHTGPSTYELYTSAGTDASGKPTTKVERFNKQSGNLEDVPRVEGQGVPVPVRGTGAGGRSSVYQQKLVVGNALYGEGTKEAADYANSTKPTTEYEIQKAALAGAQREAATDRTLRYNSAKMQEFLARRTPELAQQLRSALPGTSQPPAARPPAAPAAQRPDMMTPGNGQSPANLQMPPRPPSLPPDALGWSPSTGLWFTKDGRAFDKDGNPVQR